MTVAFVVMEMAVFAKDIVAFKVYAKVTRVAVFKCGKCLEAKTHLAFIESFLVFSATEFAVVVFSCIFLCMFLLDQRLVVSLDSRIAFATLVVGFAVSAAIATFVVFENTKSVQKFFRGFLLNSIAWARVSGVTRVFNTAAVCAKIVAFGKKGDWDIIIVRDLFAGRFSQEQSETFALVVLLFTSGT